LLGAQGERARHPASRAAARRVASVEGLLDLVGAELAPVRTTRVSTRRSHVLHDAAHGGAAQLERRAPQLAVTAPQRLQTLLELYRRRRGRATDALGERRHFGWV
jgi:hypothetical protein